MRQPGKISYLKWMILLMILTASVSCKTIKNVAPTQMARSYSSEQREFMLADSLNGYVFLENTAVKVRTTFESDTVKVEFRTGDRLSIRSILINGVSVWLDPKGEKQQNFGIDFPAARSEILRRFQELSQQQNQNTGLNEGEASADSLSPPPPPVFNAREWVESLQNRNAVITDSTGTRFADSSVYKVFLDNDGDLVYQINFSFGQLGVETDELKSLSVGIISQLHQAVFQGSQGGGGIATRPDITDRNRQPRPQQPPQRPTGSQLIPVEGWILFLLTNDPIELENKTEYHKNTGDDIYDPR
jgi:hypothetical protein